MHAGRSGLWLRWSLSRSVSPSGIRCVRQAQLPAATQTVRRLLIGLPRAQPLARAASMPLGTRAGVDGNLSRRDAAWRMCWNARASRNCICTPWTSWSAVPIPQTEGAFGPFFSPDGRWIGFFADNKLKKVAVSGGAPIDLCCRCQSVRRKLGDGRNHLVCRRRGASSNNDSRDGRRAPACRRQR